MGAYQAAKSEPDVTQPTNEVWSYLHQLIGRPEFNTSERNKRFLAYVVEETLAGRADRIKAYNIALAVFDRSEDFDPLIDPIVRIEASRLRRALEHYYLTAGKADEIRIDIPKGSYVATFTYGEATASEMDAAAQRLALAADVRPPLMATGIRYWAILAPVLAAFLIAAACLALYKPWNSGDGKAAMASPPPLSIAVLSFENTGGDANRAFLARGLTYETIIRLTQLDGVAVFGADGGLLENHGNQAAARSDYALFGSVQAAANRIRVTTLLADTRTGQFLKSWNFERDLETAGYADLQADIAAQIVLAVRQLCAIGIEPGVVGSPGCRPPAHVAAN
jgi:TolB-like protein